jgi:hypothetical protein
MRWEKIHVFLRRRVDRRHLRLVKMWGTLIQRSVIMWICWLRRLLMWRRLWRRGTLVMMLSLRVE